MPPVREKLGPAWLGLAIDLDGFGLQQERSELVRREFWFADNGSPDSCWSRFVSNFTAQLQSRGVVGSQAVEKEERRRHEQIKRRRTAPPQGDQPKRANRNSKRSLTAGVYVGCQDSDTRRDRRADERLARPCV